MTVAVPELETNETVKLTMKIAELEARGKALAEATPSAHALATADPKHKAAYQDLIKSSRSIQIELGEAQRNLRHIREERREKLARELVANGAYREALLEALVERSEALTSQAELFRIHQDARRRGIMLAPALPPEVGRDVDALLAWAREVIRANVIKPGDLPKGWLRRELESER